MTDQNSGMKEAAPPDRLSESLETNLIRIRNALSNSADLTVKRFRKDGIRMAFLFSEGMVNITDFGELIARPMTQAKLSGRNKPAALLRWIREKTLLAADQKEIYLESELYTLLMSGFVILLIDGADVCFAFGLQGFPTRSISEPDTEVNLRGGREGFTESLKLNLTMLRRRIKSPTLVFEPMTVGTRSRTEIALVYLSDRAEQGILSEIRRRLQDIPLETVLDSGYLQPFLEEKPLSLFTSVGMTERPDTLCGKISEGRVGIVADGSPFVLVVPYFFTENFQSMDDYSVRPYFAAFTRWLKYLSFFVSFLLPAFYVAVSTFHPELYPHALLYSIASAQAKTPFPIMAEALLIQLIFEIMREAGLRMPRAVGHAVSIAGALVIGDAAVSAGLIASPMVMIVALTAVSSFAVPSVYQPVAVLKFIFILLGGFFGIYGIALGLSVILLNLCSKTVYGIPFTAPVSPFSSRGMRDVAVRQSWLTLGRRTETVQHYPGSVWNRAAGKEK